MSRLSGLGFGLKVREIWETFMCLLGAHGCGGFTSYECLVSLETLFSTSSLILGLRLGFRVRAKESKGYLKRTIKLETQHSKATKNLEPLDRLCQSHATVLLSRTPGTRAAANQQLLKSPAPAAEGGHKRIMVKTPNFN